MQCSMTRGACYNDVKRDVDDNILICLRLVMTIKEVVFVTSDRSARADDE